jgi:hypothetical protein
LAKPKRSGAVPSRKLANSPGGWRQLWQQTASSNIEIMLFSTFGLSNIGQGLQWQSRRKLPFPVLSPSIKGCIWESGGLEYHVHW